MLSIYVLENKNFLVMWYILYSEFVLSDVGDYTGGVFTIILMNYSDIGLLINHMYNLNDNYNI